MDSLRRTGGLDLPTTGGDQARTGGATRHVQQPWTNGFQATSTRHEYVLYYGDSPVEYHTIVGVDDSRAFVPDPQQPQSPGGTYSITPYQATLGEIVTGDVETFNAYLNRAGIVVQQ